MIKDDDKKIWEALFENKKSGQDEEIIEENPMILARMAIPYVANAIHNFVMQQGQRQEERRESDEEGSSCPTVDGLITSANADEEAEGAWPPRVATPEGGAAVDVELESWWEYDPHDVMIKVYHGKLRQLPPPQGTPEYERNFEKVFDWLEGKYPQPSEDAEGVEGIKITDEDKAFEELDKTTPL